MEGAPKMNRREFIKASTGAVIASSLGHIEGTEISKETPSEGSLQEMFKVLQEGRDFTQRRKLIDDQGVYLWETEAHVTDIDGTEGTAEFGYMRKGRFSEGSSSYTKIYVTFFDETGMPDGGHDVAEYKNGEWLY